MASTSKSEQKFSPPPSPPIQSNPTPPSIPTTPPRHYPYDVFLSFRGADTRNTLTDHLYTALVDSGIHTFRDDDELYPGGVIEQELMKAIEESRIAIVVFSKNYAASSWCLDELVRIIDCKKSTGKIVLPVFYHVDPSDVRRQKKSFAKAFRKHQERLANESDKLNRWRSALKYAANLSGLDLRYFNGSESGLIKQIVKDVLTRGRIKKMFVAKHPVGLDSRLNVIIPLLVTASDDVRLIGISGMGGIGKTTITKALYNETLRYFDSSCFLANINEVSARPNGLESLQEQLLFQLSMTKNDKVPNLDRGIEMIKERFCFKKVLIVLDDLDKSTQADALAIAGCQSWFGPGSRIILTTRNENLLQELEVDATYCPQELNYNESLELFCLHSFKSRSPPHGYTTCVNNLTDYCRGLPLALKVLGSYLSGKNVPEWDDAFEKLQRIQHEDIHEILKISYDGLDDEVREIFLDIAYFFVGVDKDYATEILKGCGFSAAIGIKVLRERCLVTVDQNSELRMHGLLQDMAREIIRSSFPRDPCKRNRLWIPTDETEVLAGNKEAGAIEGVQISQKEEEIHLHAETFLRMRNLRLLQLGKVNLQGDFCFISSKIRWICWQEYPLSHLPCELQLINIVALDMQHSKMNFVWKGIQFLEHLKMLNLSHSKHLRSTPDFTKMRKLATLILEGCTSLLKIHQSIGCLASLVFLNLKDCKQIKTIPEQFCCLRSLQYLNLSGCSRLEGLPENFGEIENLMELSADETAITQLPSSLGLLRNLLSLSLKGCNKKAIKRSWFPFTMGRSFDTIRFLPPSITGLGALRKLILQDCDLSYHDIPVDIGRLSALQELDLSKNSFSRLPQSFNKLTNLESLNLDNWNDLCSLPEVPSNLKSLVRTTSQSSPYNAFLSFSGLNTRDTFTDHLYTALVKAGIHVFRDDEPSVGGIISHELMPAIKESRIAIIVLSANYASSTWCLDNLARIIECKQAKEKAVLPIFYHVDRTDLSLQGGTNFRNSPSEEASQIGSFAEAFQNHVARYVGELDKVEKWRSALSYTTDLRGFSLQDFNGSESSLSSHIMKEVQWELKRLFVAKHPVGLESRLEKVRQLLQLESNEIRVIRILGDVGSGKTVIAKAIYNENLQHFDSSCFLGDIKTVSARPTGVVYLQNQLLYQLGMGENHKVESVTEGIKVIENTCRHKKVLIVLDGLYDDEQADILLGNLNLYGPGSRIILVTNLPCGPLSYLPSDATYLNKLSYLPSDATYLTEWLNLEEWVELLSWHSFGTPTLPTDYAMLTEDLKYSFYKGNPLAAVVMSIYLYGRSIHEWRSALQRGWNLDGKEIKKICDIVVPGSIFYDMQSFTIRNLIRAAYVIVMFNGRGGVHTVFGAKFLLDKCFPMDPNWTSDPRVQEILRGMGFRSLFPEIQ